MENYPGFKTACQKALDELVDGSGWRSGAMELVYAEESSLLGAAVAVGCVNGISREYLEDDGLRREVS